MDTDPKLAGFEAVLAFNWGVTKISSDTYLLNISHPRFGGLSFHLPEDGVRRLIAGLEEKLASAESTSSAQARFQ